MAALSRCAADALAAVTFSDTATLAYDSGAARPDFARLADAAGVPGPLAALLAALRHAPAATWLTCPCDLPAVTPEAAAWLRGEARSERAAVLPRTAPDAPPEPLLATMSSLTARSSRSPDR